MKSILFYASQCHFLWSLKVRVGTLGHKLGLVMRLDDTMRQGKLDLSILQTKTTEQKVNN